MGSKHKPGKFDCYDKALPDEPMFVLLARDPDFDFMVQVWAARRQQAIRKGERPQEDMEMVMEANECAVEGYTWRINNLNKWRRLPTK